MVGGGWQTKFNVSPGPGLLSRSRSRSGPDWEWTWTGPDLGPGMGPGMGPEPELDKKVKVNTHPKLSTKFFKVIHFLTAAAWWRRSRIDLPRLWLCHVDDNSPERLPGRADNEEGQVISVSRMSRWLLPSRKVKWKSEKYRHRQCCITDWLWEAGAGK